jgi:hypothetical protein
MTITEALSNMRAAQRDLEIILGHVLKFDYEGTNRNVATTPHWNINDDEFCDVEEVF